MSDVSDTRDERLSLYVGRAHDVVEQSRNESHIKGNKSQS